MVDSEAESDISCDSLQGDSGCVTEKLISKGLSNRGYSADGTELVDLNLSLSNKSLADISLLQNYKYMQSLDVSNNKLTDVSVIGELRYLLELNASNNCLTVLPLLSPPINLLTADLSSNNITDMRYIGAVGSLSNLNLDHNEISEINGLKDCSSLKDLSLNHNKILRISGLETLHLTSLSLRNNNISKITGLEALHSLHSLDLANNNIRSLRGLQNKMVLAELHLEGNDIIDLLEIKQLQGLPLLRRLTLQTNPLTALPAYRAHLLFYLPALSHLDDVKILPEEKIAALNQFDPPLEVIAAENHMLHVVKDLIHPIHIRPSTLYPSVMSDTSSVYPVLVLTGPCGAGKSELLKRLTMYTANTFKIVPQFTTKLVPDDIKMLHSVEKDTFEEMVEDGEFLVSYEVGGCWYGLRRSDIELAAEQGVASVLAMELEGVLSLKRTAYQPRVALITPLDPVKHEARLRARQHYSEPIIKLSVQRNTLYTEYHDSNPGNCDIAINSSDIDKAFDQLVQLIEYYSGARSGLGPGQGEVMGEVSSNLGRTGWSSQSSANLSESHLPRKQAIVEGAVKGVSHPTTPRKTSSSKLTSDIEDGSLFLTDCSSLSSMPHITPHHSSSHLIAPQVSI